MIRLAMLFAAVFLCHHPTLCAAQQSINSVPYTYEVASIREYKGEPTGISTRPDSFHSDVSLASLIRFAFNAELPEQISGIPHWAESVRYLIQAKVDEKTMNALQKLPVEERLAGRRQLIIAMLTDRFGLKFHYQDKKVPVYELVVAKHGPKLQRSADKEHSSSSMGRGTLKGTGMTTADLAHRLSGTLGQQVIDKTGLDGRYDMEMSWSIDDSPQSTDTKPSLFTAVQDELGLRLLSSKATMSTPVIDALEKPSEN